MQYIQSKDIDFEDTFFHFTRIDNRESIEKYGLKSVAGGENLAGRDSDNPTIYFAYKADGLLKAVDAWIKWEYNRLRMKRSFEFSPTEKISEEIMKEIYQKVYEDFKDRLYLKLDLIEGKNPEESDFSFDDIDKKKEDEYNRFKKDKLAYSKGYIKWQPHYPNKCMGWMYGSYSDFSNGNMKQDSWNMNTHIGKRTIPTDRIEIIEGETGRTDALSVAMEVYDKFRDKLQDIDLSILDEFMEYAKVRYKEDKDYKEGTPDLGRRSINLSKEKQYQKINKIMTQDLGKQVINEMLDTILIDETERVIKSQERAINIEKESQEYKE